MAVCGRAKTRSRHPIPVLFLLYHTPHGGFSFIHQLQAEPGWDIPQLTRLVLSCDPAGARASSILDCWLAAIRSQLSMNGRQLLVCYINPLPLGLSYPDKADFHRALSKCPLIANFYSGSWSSRKEKLIGQYHHHHPHQLSNILETDKASVSNQPPIYIPEGLFLSPEPLSQCWEAGSLPILYTY